MAITFDPSAAATAVMMLQVWQPPIVNGAYNPSIGTKETVRKNW